jgi:S-adenosylmethionine:tRNA ribosyltransferase-isomerase
VRVADFDYRLPADCIAQEAIEPRDASRLLVLPGLEDRWFRDLPELLDAGDLLVVNRTRVRPARLHGHRSGTGGKVELLLTKHVAGADWEALVRPARRMRPGVRIECRSLDAVVTGEPAGGVVPVRIEPRDDLTVEEAIVAGGDVPLPPYFRGSLPDPERYQTMFAASSGSAAAPTAGLHFTPGLVEALAERGVAITEVELDVGLDTFRPMSGETVAEHTMHRERFHIPAEAVRAVARVRQEGGRVVAVGTTTVRTLEAAATADGSVRSGSAETGLFITPGYCFRVVDALITNFHAPRTSLIALVAAFAGPQWRPAYAHALAGGYRFLSFGDAMFIGTRHG